MNFLERLSGALQKKNINNFNSSIKKPFLGNGFASNALKKKELKNDVYQSAQSAEKLGLLPKQTTNPIAPSTFDAELAINNPVKFINNYVNTDTINEAIAKNPNIASILEENGLTTKYEIKNVQDIIYSHLIPTAKKAQDIYEKMGHSKTEDEYVYLAQAALLHDIGKAFIPSEILNKKGKLSHKEREIIELHNRLSQEVLKTTGLHPKVAQLAFEHHDYDKNIKKTQANQALRIADIYSALRENRPYKAPISDIGARTILYDIGTKGEIDTRYIRHV